MTLAEALQAIEPIDVSVLERARARLDRLTKPRGSLGRLEDLAAKVAAMTRHELPKCPRAVVFTFAADHGVTEEGVSAYPSAVTAQMVANFLRGGAGVNVLARHAGAEVRVVDIGVAADLGTPPGLIVRKVAYGSRNLLRAAALEGSQALRAIEIGIDLARTAAQEGVGLIGTGDMGIGNTTPSAAITAVITGTAVGDVTGAGTGLDEGGLRRKISVIERALALHQPDPRDALEVLTKVGGLEIAGLTGLMIGAASCRIPIALDGFISGSAALLAATLHPACVQYMIPSHVSVEPGHRIALAHLGLSPLLDLQLRLGEGTGACLGIGLVHAAVKVMTEMATFEEAGVSKRHRP